MVQIKNRFTDTFIAEGETVREAAEAYRANLRAANLRGANLRAANLRGANLRAANLRGANLYRADLTGADLTGANLTGADLYRADLTGADLRGADLTGADLTGANLTGANLYRADLTGADLYRANLTGADLYRANLRGADLTWAKGVVTSGTSPRGYSHWAWIKDGTIVYCAGCRAFTETDEYRAYYASAEYASEHGALSAAVSLALCEMNIDLAARLFAQKEAA